MSALHDSAVRGHSGFPVTYRRIKSNFAWPGMKHQIREFVQGCQICQQAKPERVKYDYYCRFLSLNKHGKQLVLILFLDFLQQAKEIVLWWLWTSYPSMPTLWF
jgi:hypothetical protein